LLFVGAGTRDLVYNDCLAQIEIPRILFGQT
jgi:hypothetical protein